MIQWVWEAATRCSTLDGVIIATDDIRIHDVCVGFGAQVVLTPPDCPTGSDRIALAMAKFPHQVIVNIQGDEPLIDPATIDACVHALVTDPDAGVATAMTPVHPTEDFTVPHIVKVVTDKNGYAMYFSRAPIPDYRRLSKDETTRIAAPMKHIGLYVYRRSVLNDFVKTPPSNYELIEKLEQLRLLESGVKIRMVRISASAIGVDTPEDVPHVEDLLQARNA